MIETAANMMWGIFAIASACFIAYGAGICALHSLFQIKGSSFARRVLTGLSRALREGAVRFEQLAHREF